MLSEGLREPSRPRWALHGAGGVGWAVEAPDGLDAGVELTWAHRGEGGCRAVGRLNLTAPR